MDNLVGTMELETLEELKRFSYPFPENNAVKEWKRQGKKVMGYACIYTPEELFYAAGMMPFRLSGDNEELPLKKAESYLYINTCSFARTCLQVGLDGGYDFLDGLVIGETCDGARRLYDVWLRYLHIPFMHIFGIPRKFTQRAYKFYQDDLQELKEKLEEFFKIEITDESLRCAIEVYNKTRVLLQQLYEFRKQEAPPIYGAEVLEVVKAAMRVPRDQYNLLLEKLIEELSTTDRRIEKKVRLMINGSVLHNSDYIRAIEDLGAIVVTDELCTGTRYCWENVDTTLPPLEGLANYYLGRPACARFQPSERRFEHVFRMVEEFNVHGIITEIIRYCVPYAHDEPILKEKLKERDIPVLDLDLEYGQGGTGQIRTRAEAFIEMLNTMLSTKS